MSDIAAPLAAGTAPQGRSLWANAWLRLRKNRAAVVSLAVLGAITFLCLFGPYLSPHPYDRVYTNYLKAEPSLTPYPRAAEIRPELDAIAARMRVKVTAADIGADKISVTLEGARAIDERLTAYFERSDLFGAGKIIAREDEGRRLIVEAPVKHLYFLFGTDPNGRDLLTRTLIAGRVSLLVGLLASGVALVIGVAWGAAAGYAGGRTDMIMMRIVDILYALPFIFFVILLIVFFGRQFVLIFVAIGAIEWLDMARIVRGQTLAIKRQEYVQAAEALGVGTGGILRRHIIPNTLGSVVVYLTLLIPKVILIESFISFLGLGVQEPYTSWGGLITDGARNIQGAAYLLIVPGLFLTATLFSLNFIGDGLRDALDPKDR